MICAWLPLRWPVTACSSGPPFGSIAFEKNNSCLCVILCYFERLLLRSEGEVSSRTQTGRTALIVPVPVGAGGHNNIRINPVFRGMVPRFGESGF